MNDGVPLTRTLLSKEFPNIFADVAHVTQHTELPEGSLWKIVTHATMNWDFQMLHSSITPTLLIKT